MLLSLNNNIALKSRNNLLKVQLFMIRVIRSTLVPKTIINYPSFLGKYAVNNLQGRLTELNIMLSHNDKM